MVILCKVFLSIYAPASYLNSSIKEVKGAILEARIGMGAKVNFLTVMFINLRYLGGGATGTDTCDTWPGSGYVKNWFHFLNFSAGFVLKL